MKEYIYENKLFKIEVTFTGIFCSFIMIVAMILAIAGWLAPLMLLIVIVAGYTCWNSFVSKSNSEKVIIGEDYISFYAYGREDHYDYKDLIKLRIREFPTSGKMYIRVNDSNVFKGRYWIQTKVFSDGKELFQRLLDLEYSRHPETLKARARRVNTEYIAAEKAGLITPKKKRKK